MLKRVFLSGCLLGSLMCCQWLAGCAVPMRVLEPVAALFDDAAFAQPQQRISASDLLKPSPAMQAHVRDHITPTLRWRNAREALIEALYTRSQLQLRYDAEVTRTPAEAFQDRAGNCLSLVMMTAVFAREIGLPIRFQQVPLDEEWGRDGDLLMFVGHVNVALGGHVERLRFGAVQEDWTTVDFLPGVNLRHQRHTIIDEARVVAMYMNNKAAEALAQGQVDEAYWWARESVVQDPGFGNGHNTLGVVYLRHGQAKPAEAAFRRALVEDADNPHTMNNLALALTQQGRQTEAHAVTERMQRLLPSTPYGYYERGQQAMRQGDLRLALQSFEKAVRQGGDHHEFHFALAQVLARQGDAQGAARELDLARQNSGSPRLQLMYAGKLQRLREQLVH